HSRIPAVVPCMSGGKPAPPSWLFANNSSAKPATVEPKEPAATATMAKKSEKTTKSKGKAKAGAAPAKAPPAELMDMVESFLSEHSFSTAHAEFKKTRAANSWKAAA